MTSAHRWGILAGAITVLLVAILLLTLVGVRKISSVQGTNSQKVAATESTVKYLKALTAEVQADERSLAKGNTTVSQILIEAGQAVQQLETLETAICKATPGCVIPT